MSIKYIPLMERGRPTIMEYGTGNGYRECGPGKILIYHGSMVVEQAFDTLDEAMSSWGEWSTIPVRLPDGTEKSPMKYFNQPTNVWEAIIQDRDRKLQQAVTQGKPHRSKRRKILNHVEDR